MTNKFFYVDTATFDLNSNGVNTTTLGLVCSPENSRDLMGIIEDSQGKIVISAYKKPENLAQKCRKETTEYIIKHLYSSIEKAKEALHYSTGSYTPSMSTNSANEIMEEFRSKGFDVHFDEHSRSLKISWK